MCWTTCATRTGRATLVANVLRRFPFPPINAPSGPALPVHGRIRHLLDVLVAEDLDATFAAQLERASESVVVWIPARPRVDRGCGSTADRGESAAGISPAARFGRIEVWRRAAPAPLTSPAAFP